MARRRPSGLNKSERRFAAAKMPDGRIIKIPQAKDAATFISIATDTGDWPERCDVVLLYDVTYLVEGSFFELEEMRPGEGMGSRVMLHVLKTRTRVKRHEGNYGQMERHLLCEVLPLIEEEMALTLEDLQRDLPDSLGADDL